MRNRRSTALLAVCLCLVTFAEAPAQAGRPMVAAAPAKRGAAADRSDDAARAVRRAEALLEHASATAQAAARRLAAATAAMPVAQRRVATTRGAVVATKVEANTTRRQADRARAEYKRVADYYATAAQRVREARDRVDRIAATSYMGSTFARLNVLVTAAGPQDMLDRMGLVEQLMDHEQAEVRTLVGARREARAAQDRAGAAKRAAENFERIALDKLRAAQTAQAAAERARRAMYHLVLARKTALSAAQSQRATVLAQYRAALAAERRVQASLRGWEARGGRFTGRYGGGRLTMPVRGWKSSDYGNRYDPYYRVWQLHAGTDFAAGSGSAIRAAASGRVIRAGWYGGYGNYTCINHGKLGGYGFTTCYAHQSRMYVRPGSAVRRGQVIGKVGSTGASTGAHLHFETRFGGVPRNPLNYLPGCLC
ncbi:M23 family metallopeptidase [Actinoplanes sp. DH11]|uniref:M23 family metallopeptidase n=1 Tax=Actinoplanes sp. DH11 TaxID=2857011 RepID=UPI001E64EA17|nr:M23 family metallopeptidase [Actinoplanes sp. DH11]